MQKKSSVGSIRRRATSKRVSLGKRERRRLIQLLLCVVLFCAVFLGKEKLPTQMFQFINFNTDFKSAFIAIGEAVSNGESITETLGNFAVSVFGVEDYEEEIGSIPYEIEGLEETLAADFWSEKPDAMRMLYMLGISANEDKLKELADSVAGQPQEQEEAVTTSPAPEIPEYTGPALPTGATMEYYTLDVSNFTVPIQGEITSEYGYRDHPVSGEYLFHTGVDIAANKGMPIAAFADGTVDFIGESEAYGLYIQLNHGNGITTFYCHCSDLFARKGESVTGGQIIAAVGDSGNATGPHLHLELEREGVLLNPAYYLDV